MKMKNGYTLIELILVIVFLGIVTVFVAINISRTFQDNTEELYNSTINNILVVSKQFGKNNIEEVKESKIGIVVTVNDLIEEGLISANKDGNIINPKNTNLTLNDLKVRIKYDAATESITTELVN